MKTKTIKPSRVLVVDDEKSIRIGLKAFLENDGYKTVVAADAHEALRMLSEQAFDVVVSDIVLTETNGIELLKSIGAAAPFVPVIMMTGDPTVDTAAEALRAGAFDYLVKPVTKNSILHVVGNAAQFRAVDNERRRLAAENKRYQENLEMLIAERTSELSKAMAELKEAQSEMIRHERLNALSQLSAGICHDFNNVLMPILGLSGELVEHPDILEDQEETLSLLKVIHSASEDARLIVQRMREFYHPRDGMEMEQVAVDALLHDVVELTRPRWEAQAQSEGRIIQVVCDAEAVHDIVGNAPQLREALTNLILNAADAISEKGTIRVSATQEGETIDLSVTDTGAGMPDAVCKRCLEPFFSTKGKHGTGMGLAMVHGIVKRHNGTLEIESELSKGTSVKMRLPMEEEAVTPATEALTQAASVGTLRILVIDDEEWSRTLIERYLKDAGHCVETVEDGMSGLKSAAGKAFDMVITDQAMPDMSGEQFAVALKKHLPKLPVLLLSGTILKPGAHIPAEVNAVLEKPVTHRELIEAVNRLAVVTGETVLQEDEKR